MTKRLKRVVVNTGLREADIRPPALLSEFKRLSVQDSLEFFRDPTLLIEVACPCCDSSDFKAVFKKNEFMYNLCGMCATLFVSPRPSQEALENYYANSRAGKFRIEHYSRDTAKARRFYLLASHAQWMGQIVDEAGTNLSHDYADMNTYSPEIFDEIRLLGLFHTLCSVEPLLPCPSFVKVIKKDSMGGLGAISAFEKLEHQFSPFNYMLKIRDSLVPGGLFFFTTRAASGFDLQVLWDETPYIFVPEHLNLPSIEGLVDLVQRAGFELIELSTPGQLDLELVSHAVTNDPSIQLPSFVKYLIERRDKEAHWDFQEFLQKHRLSSHVRVAIKKKEI